VLLCAHWLPLLNQAPFRNQALELAR